MSGRQLFVERLLYGKQIQSFLLKANAQLAALPTEEQALTAYKSANDTLFQTAGNLMRAMKLLIRAEEVSNEVYEGNSRNRSPQLINSTTSITV